MILSCPHCGTRYSLSESQLGPNGRKVRCSACKTTWHADPPPAEPIELAPEPPVKPRVEDLQQVKAERLPSRYRALIEDKKRLRALTVQGLVWGGLAAAFVAFAPNRAAWSCSAPAFFSAFARSFLRRSSSAARWRW